MYVCGIVLYRGITFAYTSECTGLSECESVRVRELECAGVGMCECGSCVVRV